MIKRTLLNRLYGLPNGRYFIIFTVGEGVLQHYKVIPVDVTGEGIIIGLSEADRELIPYLNSDCNIYTSDFISEAAKEFDKKLRKEYF